MNPDNVNTDINSNVVQNEDGSHDVIYQRNQNQRFSGEDFVQVYNDTIQNLRNVMDNIKDSEEEITDMLGEKEEAMNLIHGLVESEQQTLEDIEISEDSLTVDDINAFMQLQQKKQQKQQLVNQEASIRNQLHDMKEAARRVADKPEEELKEIPEKKGVEKGVSLET